MGTCTTRGRWDGPAAVQFTGRMWRRDRRVVQPGNGTLWAFGECAGMVGRTHRRFSVGEQRLFAVDSSVAGATAIGTRSTRRRRNKTSTNQSDRAAEPADVSAKPFQCRAEGTESAAEHRWQSWRSNAEPFTEQRNDAGAGSLELGRLRGQIQRGDSRTCTAAAREVPLVGLAEI